MSAEIFLTGIGAGLGLIGIIALIALRSAHKDITPNDPTINKHSTETGIAPYTPSETEGGEAGGDGD